jgi:hypothetical protein
MKSCIACSMPLNSLKEIGCEVSDGWVCVHCSTPDGKVKSCEEVFEGGVQFFMGVTDKVDRSLAEKLTRKNMNRLPYWQKNKEGFLNGEEATDEEFSYIFSKL